MHFSIIVPVYNRPEELQEFLTSLAQTTFTEPFEVVVVEDGSTRSSASVVKEFQNRLSVAYFEKPNTGPGDSRNYGMRRAIGNYFLIFDSDCLIPADYLSVVARALRRDFVHCFGGPDAAHPRFSSLQKAISFAMTSVLTTGGVRGAAEHAGRFQPRSFNMGLSKEAFDRSGGFGDIHPGEDPDLAMRLWELGYETRLISEAFVYHKRRIDWKKFHLQVTKFGKVRPILDKRFPKHAKPAYWFPSVFIVGAMCAVFLAALGFWLPVALYLIYFVCVGLVAAVANRSLSIGFLAMVAVAVQFYGYGGGFLQSFYRIRVLKQQESAAFPELFFKK